MPAPGNWKSPLSPLNIAGYVTWTAVFLDVWRSAATLPSVGPMPALVVAAALMIAFLIAFAQTDRLRHAALPVMIASAFALLWLGRMSSSPVLLIIIAAVAAARLPPRTTVALMIAMNAALVSVLLWRWPTARTWLIAGTYIGFQTFAAIAAHAVRRASETADELRQVNAHLLATRSLLAESARDGERLRLSRELHDVSGHKLTALKLNLAVMASDTALVEHKELATARSLVDELLRDIRGVVAQLRTHDGIDLREAMTRLAEPLPFSNVHVRIDDDARVDDAECAATLVRLAQEGLTNAAKHASPQNVWLKLTRDRDAVQLVVEDDGALTSPVRPGHGLTGMRERVTALGGELEIGTGALGGLRISARLPRGRAP
jgi:signal transduction histidine kinase